MIVGIGFDQGFVKGIIENPFRTDLVAAGVATGNATGYDVRAPRHIVEIIDRIPDPINGLVDGDGLNGARH